MITYFLLLDKNQTTDQKVVSSNPAGCAIKKAPLFGAFFVSEKHFLFLRDSNQGSIWLVKIFHICNIIKLSVG